MAGFTQRAYGSAQYSKTTGIIVFSMTEGKGAYQLNDPQPGFADLRLLLRDGAPVRYRSTSGINQEIANGRFDYAGNRLVRTRIVLPRDGALDWGPGRKIIYILDDS